MQPTRYLTHCLGLFGEDDVGSREDSNGVTEDLIIPAPDSERKNLSMHTYNSASNSGLPSPRPHKHTPFSSLSCVQRLF